MMRKIVATSGIGLIETRISGFMSIADVEAYANEVEPLLRRFAVRGHYRMLIDVSDCAIQTQDVINRFQKHVASMPRAERVAVVTGSSIVKMQIRRIMYGTGVEIFADRRAALAWIA